MLHSLGRKFHYGDKEVFKKMNVFFLQGTPTKFRVRKMGLVEKEVCLLQKCSGVNLKHNEPREILLKNLINMVWKLKIEIENNLRRVEELAQSHQDNLKSQEKMLR
ncbi:hypothetical protein BCV72DRAFT_42865 [Rhizopus microsporus var. microsporus]|uniref:Uncharacterized protein n=1 Tax=Rhizopus microsporus var. microsporus TaxID=86635 RepID=A0A1X0RD45_RHIZD|nr:hypothetical protein BCV72DRAFT_42865 [Rhizopus microsporus var. microsporus]